MEEEDQKPILFHEMNLDDRILKAIAKLGWCEPTLIQQKAIPFILDGKDVLAKGRTGSGKTGAFAIPVIQKILDAKKTASEQCVKALLLAPSRELAGQINQAIADLTRSCGRVVRSVDVSSTAIDVEAQKQVLVGDLPDIIVGTPSRVLAHLKAGHLDLSESLEMLVIDEADLIFSFGHENDLKAILSSNLPSTYQAVLTSATLSEDVAKLKKLVLHSPISLKLEEPSLPDAGQLTQYKILVEQDDKFVLIYALFKLKLIQGKTIIFVNTVDRCYQIKLYLEQFGIPVCVLNSELPTASRCHILSQFNKGIYEVIVASDEKFLMDNEQASKRNRDKESGVARGIDFQYVSNVINFDFPLDTDSYIHRVGRTARGKNKGCALSLISARELERAKKVEKDLHEREGLGGDDEDETVLKPYQFKLEELDGFKYRAMDAWRSVTKIAIREARLKEIRQEILNSAKLQAHLVDNPKDAKVLRHDKALHTIKHQPQLRNVPDYIVPQSLKKLSLPSNKQKSKKFKSNRVSKAKQKFERRQADPLKALVSKGKRNKRY